MNQVWQTLAFFDTPQYTALHNWVALLEFTMAEDHSRTPTEADLSRLPRWARVAFAARCARRVQPLFAAWSGATSEHVDAIEATNRLAESWAHVDRTKDSELVRAARNAAAHFSAREAARIGAIAEAAATNAIAHISPGTTNSAYAETEYAGATAASVAAFVAADAATSAGDATTSAARAARAADATRTLGAANAAWSDYNILLALAKEDEWTDDSTVDLELLGPLWPQGEPEWWSEEEMLPGDMPPVLALEFSIPPGLDQDKAAKHIGSLIETCNQMHHAFGGTGLRFHEPPVSFESAPCPIPAGGGDDDRGSGDGWRGGGGGGR